MKLSPQQQNAFKDWKDEANAVGLIGAWAMFGNGALRRVGAYHTGPCPACGGKDRFSINARRQLWNCRGAHGGGDAISLAMHVGGLSFMQAIERLTGRPNPTGGPSKPVSEAARAATARLRAANERTQRQREAQQEAYEANTREVAQSIWDASVPIAGTACEKYLAFRCNGPEMRPICDLDCLRHHAGLPYPGMQGRHPALVCRVDDMSGNLTAIWRVYLAIDGARLVVGNPKLGLGPAGGGAVRIGGTGPKIAIAEGVETALGYWLLTGRRYPCWASLSTSGMKGIELPLSVRSVVIVPDGDSPMRRNGSEYVPAIPPGRDAAHSLRVRLLGQGVDCTIAPEPAAGTDYLDIWKNAQEDACRA